MKIEVPFYSQKWDLAQWKNMGFNSFEDAKYWEKSSCGILCLKMAIDTFLLSQRKPLSPPIVEYIKRGIKIGAYRDSVGWTHEGLAQLSKEFNFSAVSMGSTKVVKLCEALRQNFLPIISIKWAFENHKTLKEKFLFWKKFGGHLALVVGFEEDNGELEGFYIHHTSILPEHNWQYKFVPLEKFKQGFTGRCIIIKS